MKRELHRPEEQEGDIHLEFLRVSLEKVPKWKTLDHDGIRGSLNKFPGFFRMGSFIDSTQMKL